MKKNRIKRLKLIAGGPIIMAAAASAFAEQKPFMDAGTAQPPPPPQALQPEVAAAETNAIPVATTNKVEDLFGVKIPKAIADGKFNLNVRARYEQADEEGIPAITKNSYAPTIRTRFGYTTAPLYGFQAMVEGVNVSVIGPEHNYNAAGSNNQNDRPIVADPPLTRVDQAWASFNYTNYLTVKAGEQRITLDNQRFIGDNDWRQNIQTYDSAAIGSEPIENLDLYYAYIWEVKRPYGDVNGLPAANTDYNSHSHLFHVSYSGWDYGRFVGYTYLLDLQNAAGAANSCATYGGYFAGAAPICDKVSVDYRAEFAWQTDYQDSPLSYGAKYYNVEAGANIAPVAFGGGVEDLGSGVNSGAGGGRASFRTPLATFHPFNGWNSIFQTTPADGLIDIYGFAQVTLPAQIPLRFVYHKFDADYGSHDYGQEFDIMASKKFGKYWSALVEYAYYKGADAAPPALTVPNVDMQRFWAQISFNF